jgi:CubicO group peptidase (beta-lactamase class C family)
MTVTPSADRVAGRIQRIENGLLPETPLRSQPPEKRRLAERMAYHETPGVSVAVINDGEIEWARGFGVTEAGKPEPVTTETLFQAGSISKPVAAMAALRLVQEGRIDLDEDVNTYLTSWKVPPNGLWQPRVTLRQLLSHTAGLTLHGFPGYLPSRPVPTLPQILDGQEPANTGPVRVNTLPGTQFRYSGGGTTIMQLMLMDVLGQPFPEIMRAMVLDPLGMEHSTYEQPLPPARARFAATGHPSDSRPVDGKWHVYPEMAAAGLWTTASDLARFALEIQQSLAGKSNKVLSTEMVSQMLTPQVEDHMGLGPFLEGKDGSARFGHGGADEGFLANLTAYRHRGQGSVVMVNSNRGWPVISEILRAIAQEYGWPDFIPTEPAPAEVAPHVAAAYAGEYELKPNFRFTVAVGDSGLTLRTTGQPKMPLYPESETTYFARVVEATLTFVKSDTGEVRELIFKQNGKEMPAKKISP